MNRLTFEFWFDFASTYSYLSVHRIEELARPHGIAIIWKPFLLGPIFKSQGWDTSPFNIYKVKGVYMWRDIERCCDKYGIPFEMPSEFPRNGILAARVSVAFEDESWVTDFIKKVFESNFAHDIDISDESEIASVLDSLGQDPQRVLSLAKSHGNKDRLRHQTQAAIDKGLFGAPAFVIGDEIFWGNDRLEDAIEFYNLTR